MGILGDIVSQLRDDTKFLYEECGGKDVVDELKDAIKAIKGQ